MLDVKPIANQNSRVVKKLFHLVFCFGLQCLATSSISQDIEHVLFILSRDAPNYTKIVDLVRAGLSDEKKEYSFTTVSKDADTEIDRAIKEATIIVTLGTGAADAAISRDSDKPLVASLITDSAFADLAKKHRGSASKALASGINAILLDQPLERSTSLASLLIPQLEKIAIMLGPSSGTKARDHRDQLKDAGITPQILSITAADNPIHKIAPVIKNTDVFIPVPDSRLINVTTAKWILQLGYKYSVPVIGFSKNYVTAGALAAVYSAPENVARQTIEVIRDQNLRDYSLNRIHRPKYCTVTVNTTVAWHLGIQTRDERFYQGELCEL